MSFIVTDQGDGVTNTFSVPIGPTGRTAKVSGSTVAITTESPYGYVVLASVPALGAVVEITCPDISRGGAGAAPAWADIQNKPTTISGFGITDNTFTNLQGKPTTVAGYGLTDVAFPLSNTKEKANVVAAAPSANQPMMASLGQLIYFTTAATAAWTPNLVWDGGTSLASKVATNETITYTIAVTQGATAYFANALQIDGVAVTPQWIGGSAPSAGNATSTDIYTYACRKTAGGWVVIAALTTSK